MDRNAFSNASRQRRPGQGGRHDRDFRFVAVALALAALGTILPGCSSLGSFSPIPSVPVSRVPPVFFGRPKEAMIKVSMTRLRQTPPEVYQLGPGDVLGIAIENVLGNPDEPPPVHFPEESGEDPSIGFPIPVREDGSLALPYVDPIPVSGLTLNQATEAIRKAYTIDRRILQPDKDQVIVTLIEKRKYEVLVVREDGGAPSANGGKINGNSPSSDQGGTGYVIELAAYENDLLHALNATGGLPGLDAKNEVIIFRGSNPQTAAAYDGMIAQLKASAGPYQQNMKLPDNPHATHIPLRFYANNPPRFTEKDVILHEGDVVYIPSRDEERFYTGGVLGGGSYLLPRDYDLTILQAIAMAGGPIGRSGSGLQALGRGRRGGGGYGRSAPIPPSKAIVIRKVDGVGEIPIRVDLNEALTNPSERIFIQPEDTIIVQYTCCEEIANMALNMIRFNFLYGMRGNRF